MKWDYLGSKCGYKKEEKKFKDWAWRCPNVWTWERGRGLRKQKRVRKARKKENQESRVSPQSPSRCISRGDWPSAAELLRWWELRWLITEASNMLMARTQVWVCHIARFSEYVNGDLEWLWLSGVVQWSSENQVWLKKLQENQRWGKQEQQALVTSKCFLKKHSKKIIGPWGRCKIKGNFYFWMMRTSIACCMLVIIQ